MSCIGTPISWLRLERYQAGELARDDRDAIAKHVSECDVCAACLRRIEEDDKRELPPLPASAPKKGGIVVQLRRAAPMIAALAVAAALLIVIGRKPREDDDGGTVAMNRIKGGDVSFSLVNADDTVFEGGAVYRDGDRFKVVMTCPPGMRGAFDVVVYEHGEAAFPLEPAHGIACGNGVALPGAFRATGADKMTVCLVWDDSGRVDREALRHASPAQLPHASCKDLDPAP
jgi:hypothetical protein